MPTQSPAQCVTSYFCYVQGEFPPKLFDPTAGVPEESIEKLVLNLVAVDDIDGGLVPKEDTSLAHVAAFSLDVVQHLFPADPGLTQEMATELERLYAVDPTSREVSLAWTDEAMTPPFNKPLDTVEKVWSLVTE